MSRKTKNKNKSSDNKKTRKHSNGKLMCSPNPYKNNFSCFTNNTLFKMKNKWNMRHPDSKIRSMNPKKIWDELKNKMSGTCYQESCWLKESFSGGELKYELNKTFAPEAPRSWSLNPTEWLSSEDITNVMQQYEKSYKCFNFLGPSPIDYDSHKAYGECVWEELCNFNLQEQINNNINKIGIIFNLDPHYKGGSHWVSMFINIKKGWIMYFDSGGDPIPNQLMKFVNKVISQGVQLKNSIHFKFDQNYPKEHQKYDTECGMYSLYFIIYMLKDKHTKEYFKTHTIPDKKMEEFRKIFFNEKL